MKTISTKIILAMMTATLGLGAIAPATAQTAAPSAETQATDAAQSGPKAHRPDSNGQRRGPGFGLGGLLNLDRGGEAMEIALVRLSHRIDLSTDQQALLETLKSDALAASDMLTTATAELRPTPPAEGETPIAPDFAKALQNRIAFDTARLDALKSIEPAATAFFESLTDAQKAELMPDRGARGDHRGDRDDRDGPRQHGPNRG